jgi:hypothetical protein
MNHAEAARILDNGQPVRRPRASRRPAAGKPARARKPMTAAMPRVAVLVTVCIGIAIPALTLSLSTLSGRLASTGANGWLAAMAAGVGLAVLAVSLSHLAWAIGDITRSPLWASMLLNVWAFLRSR